MRLRLKILPGIFAVRQSVKYLKSVWYLDDVLSLGVQLLQFLDINNCWLRFWSLGFQEKLNFSAEKSVVSISKFDWSVRSAIPHWRTPTFRGDNKVNHFLVRRGLCNIEKPVSTSASSKFLRSCTIYTAKRLRYLCNIYTVKRFIQNSFL